MEYVGGGVDYSSGPYIIQFNVGMTRASFSIPISDDNILEDNELFDLNVNELSLPEDVDVGSIGQAIVSIVDDESKY